jgi:hypothetical protein
MQNFSELDTTIYLANMSVLRFLAQGRGKNRENMNKKEKGWKSPLSFLLRQALNIADYLCFHNQKHLFIC